MTTQSTTKAVQEDRTTFAVAMVLTGVTIIASTDLATSDSEPTHLVKTLF